MNDTLQVFWYRPLWQRMLLVSFLISLALVTSYYTYWEKRKQMMFELKKENTDFVTNIQTDIQFIHRFPPLFQLEQQINELIQYDEFDAEPQQFISQLQTLVIDSGVTLNQLQPSNTKERYQLEIQGSFIQIYIFLRSTISQSTMNKWWFSAIKLTPKNGFLTATISISSMKNHSFIKEDSDNEP